jgi:kumamolisin
VNPHPIDGRVVPDVSALSGSPYYAINVDGQPNGEGGTSAAAPLWAALIARIRQNLPAGKQLPFLTPLLYQTLANGQTLGQAGCNDVTQGNNITAQVGGYTAGPGFDSPSGWGSPNGQALLAGILSLV